MSSRRALYLETSRTPQPAEVLTTDDQIIYQASFSPIVAAEVLPYGIKTGGVMTGTAVNNEVSITAATAVMADNANANDDGIVSVSADTVTVTRPSSGVRYNAIVIDANGAYVQVQGTDNATFSATFGAAGGPPLIGDDEVLVGLVKLDSTSAAVIAASEILQYPAATLPSQERWDYPLWKDPTFNFAKTVQGQVEFLDALPLIHEDGTSVAVTRRVVLVASEPIMQKINFVSEFTPPEVSVSSSSTDTFDGPIAQQTQGVSDGSFTIAQMRDGIRDSVVAVKGTLRLIQYFEDELETGIYLWCQGVIAPDRSFDGQTAPSATVTIAATGASVETY